MCMRTSGTLVGGATYRASSRGSLYHVGIFHRVGIESDCASTLKTNSTTMILLNMLSIACRPVCSFCTARASCNDRVHNDQARSHGSHLCRGLEVRGTSYIFSKWCDATDASTLDAWAIELQCTNALNTCRRVDKTRQSQDSMGFELPS